MTAPTWRLIYKALRTDLRAASSHTPTREAVAFTQTEDAAFTLETLDILLADETVVEINLRPVPSLLDEETDGD